MATSTISKQAKSYARVIVGQIADNFVLLDESVKSCDKLRIALDEYKKAKVQGKISKFELKLEFGRLFPPIFNKIYN